MAESFTNSLTRAVGIMTSWSGSTIGAAGTSITVTANTGIGVSDIHIKHKFKSTREKILEQAISSVKYSVALSSSLDELLPKV